MSFKAVDPNTFTVNPFTLIGKEWLLITAGDEKGFNTMTASWGGLGVFWNKNAATIYVRPTRYTKEFLDKNDTFTLSFFTEEYREALALCGRVSGRDVDKVKETSLTPVFHSGTTYFQEAKLVMVCKKLLHSDLSPSDFDQSKYDSLMYPLKDYHTLYIGEVLEILEK